MGERLAKVYYLFPDQEPMSEDRRQAIEQRLGQLVGLIDEHMRILEDADIAVGLFLSERKRLQRELEAMNPPDTAS